MFSSTVNSILPGRSFFVIAGSWLSPTPPSASEAEQHQTKAMIISLEKLKPFWILTPDTIRIKGFAVKFSILLRSSTPRCSSSRRFGPLETCLAPQRYSSEGVTILRSYGVWYQSLCEGQRHALFCKEALVGFHAAILRRATHSELNTIHVATTPVYSPKLEAHSEASTLASRHCRCVRTQKRANPECPESQN